MCQHLNLDYTIYVWVDWFYHWVLVLQYLILDSTRDWICRPMSPKSPESGVWKLKSVAVAIHPVTVMMIRKHLLGQLVIQSACIQTCNSNFKTIFNLLTDRLPDCLGPGPRGSGLARLGSARLGSTWFGLSRHCLGIRIGAGNGNAFWVTLVPICPSSLPSSVTFVTTARGEPRASGALAVVVLRCWGAVDDADSDVDAESDTDDDDCSPFPPRHPPPASLPASLPQLPPMFVGGRLKAQRSCNSELWMPVQLLCNLSYWLPDWDPSPPSCLSTAPSIWFLNLLDNLGAAPLQVAPNVVFFVRPSVNVSGLLFRVYWPGKGVWIIIFKNWKYFLYNNIIHFPIKGVEVILFQFLNNYFHGFHSVYR